MRIPIRSVNVGLPRLIWSRGDEQIFSAIGKAPVSVDRIRVGWTNIDGDAQADLRVHGGADKAVYVYSGAHWSWWQSEHGFQATFASFGENLTLADVVETDVAIGDRFRWGDVLLEISQPRAPCYKLGIHTARADVPRLMTLSSRSGWYCRVLEEGVAPVAGAELTRTHASGSPNIRDAFVAALHPRAPRELCLRVHDAQGLAESWRQAIARKLAEKAAPRAP
jgi:MOSC domain-containing protein YiiM